QSGRGGVPVTPGATLPGVVLVEDWRGGTAGPLVPEAMPAAVPVQEAQGWQRNGQGQVELIAAPSATAIAPSCHPISHHSFPVTAESGLAHGPGGSR
ncbi:MAG: hypothetical protein AAFU71_16735, partial [Cyanobacteria bacterium J06632_22]